MVDVSYSLNIRKERAKSQIKKSTSKLVDFLKQAIDLE